MASPTADTYVVGAGQPVYGGRYAPGVASFALTTEAALFEGSASRGPALAQLALTADDALFSGSAVAPPSQNAALMGDSLTALSYSLLHPFTWANGVAGGKLKFVANSSVANNTIQDVIDRCDNDYTAASPGLAGLSSLGWVLLRIGTNNFRGGQFITTTSQNQYIALLTKILTYADHCIVFSVPPVGTPGDTNGQGIPGVNDWLATYCAGNPRLHFIDDCVTVDNGSGNWVSGYESGESTAVHFTNQASCRMGLDGGDALATLLASYGYPSPISLDVADVYPATQQWAANHLMSGTSGSNGIGSGQVPTSWAVSQGGSGNAATTSIVAADVGDSNQTPWLRLTPTATGNDTSSISVGPSVSHDAVTAGYPTNLDIVFELRFNAFDASKFKYLIFYVYGSNNEDVAYPAYLRMGLGPITKTLVVRSAIRRSEASLSHPTATLVLALASVGVFSGGMGSFDIRCLTIRG